VRSPLLNVRYLEASVGREGCEVFCSKQSVWSPLLEVRCVSSLLALRCVDSLLGIEMCVESSVGAEVCGLWSLPLLDMRCV
jgi:hypothetical protein